MFWYTISISNLTYKPDFVHYLHINNVIPVKILSKERLLIILVGAEKDISHIEKNAAKGLALFY